MLSVDCDRVVLIKVVAECFSSLEGGETERINMGELVGEVCKW